MLLNKLTQTLRNHVIGAGLLAVSLVLLVGLHTETAAAEKRDAGKQETADAKKQDNVKTFTLDGDRGGSFTFKNVTIKFPRGAISGTYQVRIEQPQHGRALWDLSIEPEIPFFNKPVKLSVDYSLFGGELDLSGKGDHFLLWYNEKEKVWVDLGAIDDKGGKRISVDIWHFSRYAVTDGTAGWD